MKSFFSTIILFFILLFAQSQEIGLSGFYQADMLYESRPGVSINYTHNFTKIFSTDIKYSHQYTDKEYIIGNLGGTYYHFPKFNITDLGLTCFVTLCDKKIKILLGRKHTIFYIFGNELVKSNSFSYDSNGDYTIKKEQYTTFNSSFYYSFSNELKIQITDIFTPSLLLNLNFSAGYILNGATVSGCVLSPYHIIAPFGRASIGVSYKIGK